MNLQREGNAAIECDMSSRSAQQAFAVAHIRKHYDPSALSLDEHGFIRDCNNSFELMFGFERRDLVWHHVSRLFPQLKDIELIQSGQINRLLNYLCHCGHLFQAKNQQGDTFPTYLNFVHIEHEGKHSLRLIVHPSVE